MEHRHLRYFVAVAEELHFSRAAARLHIAQPPLSQLIRRLEEELGLKLFERTKRRVALTEAGKVLLEEARATLARADMAVQRTKRAARGEIGHLNIGFIPWAHFTTSFSETIRVFGNRRPDVRLDFHSLSTPEHSRALNEGRIDIGFFAPLALPADLAYELTLSDRIVVVLPERHPLRGYRVVPLKALAKEPHILVARERISSYYDLVISLCRQAGFAVNVRHDTDHPQTTLALVAAGVGVSLVPASFQNVRQPGVVYRPVRPSANVKMIAAWRHDNGSPVLATFLEVVREVVNRKAPSKTSVGRSRSQSSALR